MTLPAPRLRASRVRTATIVYGGGLNQVDPQEVMNPGELIEAVNLQIEVNSGYRVFDAYERYDGQPAPSDASFWKLPFDTGTEEVPNTETVTGANSGATGIVCYQGVVESGSYAGGDAAGYLILTNVSGTFEPGENLQVSASTKAVTTDSTTEQEADTQALYDAYLQAAIEYRRDQIGKVPGDGKVRGVWVYNGDKYAFRDDSGISKMYKATTAGWSEVSLGSHIEFYEAGTSKFGERWTLTGQSSGATATIRRVAIFEGTYAAGTAEGLLAVSSVSGSFASDEDLDISFDGVATTDGTLSGSDLDFDAGGDGTDDQVAIRVGDKITGGTSGATATISAITVKTGSWADGNAKGTMTLSGSSGTWQDNEDINVSVEGIAKAADDARANSLGSDGLYEFVNANFKATERTYRMYGCNGTGNAFEFDGTYFCPIKTQSKTDDYPNHITRHSLYLLLSFDDGRVANSSLGEPLVFNAINGSLETGVGDRVTGLVPITNNATAIYSRNRIHILTGATTSSFVLQAQDDGAGAQEWSCQRIGIPWAFDDRGIASITATDTYGNFRHTTVSGKVRDLVDQKSGLVSCSMRVRSKSQYRVFFTDKSGVSLTFWRDKVQGIIPFELAHQATCACSEEDSDGTERLFFGGDDGYVYEMAKGTSFDDEEREVFGALNHSNYGYPGYEMKFDVAHVKVRSQGRSSIQIGAVYSYEDPAVPQQEPREDTAYGGGGRWGRVNWGQFNWGAPKVGRIRRDLGHQGETCALLFYSSSKYDADYTLEGHTMHFLLRTRVK